jgi:hypothetical protein
MPVTVCRHAAIFKAVEPLFNLSGSHCIIAETCWILQIVSAWISLMQYQCSKCSVILSEMRMQRTRVTPLRCLAATDASRSVARQQKITHVHESPFYHYARFPYPITITHCGEKYSRILFGQTEYTEDKLWALHGVISTPCMTDIYYKSTWHTQLHIPNYTGAS